MSGKSNADNADMYGGDQRNAPRSEAQQEKEENRFHEGKENSHKALDSSIIQIRMQRFSWRYRQRIQEPLQTS